MTEKKCCVVIFKIAINWPNAYLNRIIWIQVIIQNSRDKWWCTWIRNTNAHLPVFWHTRYERKQTLKNDSLIEITENVIVHNTFPIGIRYIHVGQTVLSFDVYWFIHFQIVALIIVPIIFIKSSRLHLAPCAYHCITKCLRQQISIFR